MTIQPFSESPTTIHAPDAARNERLRLTFEDPSTGHRYSAEIPGPSPRSMVLRPVSPESPDEVEEGQQQQQPKEFTAIYLPHHGYLALFSSANLASWMSNLDDALSLSSLSIPGTHNSPTCHVALPSVRCQAVPVAEQLRNGVRFLDVRVSCPRSRDSGGGGGGGAAPELALVHAAFPVSLTGPKYFSGLLATLYDFLAAHPSETVLLSVKREGTGRGSDADLCAILNRHYIGPNRARWYTGAAIPTLAQCRGRIVLVRRFQLDRETRARGAGLGIDASVWPDNVADGMCGSGLVRIQDYYGVGRAEDIQLKVRFAQEGLERAAQRVHVPAAPKGERGKGRKSKPLPLYINFLSASNFFNASCWPDRIAVKINPSMVEYLCMGHGAPGKGPGRLSIGDAATGIVVTDWVGNHGDWDLIRCIVGWNARLQMRR